MLKAELPKLQKLYCGHGSAVYVTVNRTFSKAFFEPADGQEEYEVKIYWQIVLIIRIVLKSLVSTSGI